MECRPAKFKAQAQIFYLLPPLTSDHLVVGSQTSSYPRFTRRDSGKRGAASTGMRRFHKQGKFHRGLSPQRDEQIRRPSRPAGRADPQAEQTRGPTCQNPQRASRHLHRVQSHVQARWSQQCVASQGHALKWQRAWGQGPDVYSEGRGGGEKPPGAQNQRSRPLDGLLQHCPLLCSPNNPAR